MIARLFSVSAAALAVAVIGVGVAGAAPTRIPGDGTYLVGSQVTPGMYQSAGAAAGDVPFCMWHTDQDTSGKNIDQIGDTDKVGGQQIVTITTSDVEFTSQGCQSWTRIG